MIQDLAKTWFSHSTFFHVLLDHVTLSHDSITVHPFLKGVYSHIKFALQHSCLFPLLNPSNTHLHIAGGGGGLVQFLQLKRREYFTGNRVEFWQCNFIFLLIG